MRDLAGEIEWAKASLICPEEYPAAVAAAGRDIPLDAEKVAAVYSAYEAAQVRDESITLLDFDDLLLHTAAAIENDAAVAEEFRDRYRCFVVDEYQDVTPLQQRVLSAWLGDRDDLTVVGDPNQTIYSFTGASPRYLLDFSRRFPDATVVRLERDYRSTPQVVSLANRVIAAARDGSRAASCTWSASVNRDRPRRFTNIPTSRRSRRGRGIDRPAHRIRHAAVRDRGALPDQCPVRGVRRGADRGGHRLPGPRRRGLFQPPGDPASPAGAAAGGQPRRRRRRSRARRRAGVLEPLGLTAEPPTERGPGSAGRRLVALAELVDEEVAHRPQLELARAAGRAADPRRLAAPAGGAGRHAGLAARRQGSGVGCGVPGRADRRHAADLACAGSRRRERGRRRGAPAALRRNHQGPNAFGAQLVAVAQPGRTAEPQAVPFSQRPVPADAQADPTPSRSRRNRGPRPAAGSATTS